MATKAPAKQPAKKKPASNSAKGILTKPPPKSIAGVKFQNAKYQGLNPAQNFQLNQRMQGDIALGQSGNRQLGRVNQNFNQPFDFSQLPQAPNAPDWSNIPQSAGGQDYNSYVQGQIGASDQAFDSRNNPVFANQDEQFRQRMADQGIPEGSKAFNDAYQTEQQSQNDARTQAHATAMTQAGITGTQFANVQNQAHDTGLTDQQTYYDSGNQVYGDAYGRAMQQRNQPLADYSALYGATSPFAQQNLAYSQGLGTQDNQTSGAMRAAAQAFAMSHTGRGGGGRSGRSGAGGGGKGKGGGSPKLPFDPNLDPATQRWLYQQQYIAANAPPVQQPPSYGSQLLGGLGGSFLGGLGQSFGKYLAG